MKADDKCHSENGPACEAFVGRTITQLESSSLSLDEALCGAISFLGEWSAFLLPPRLLVQKEKRKKILFSWVKFSGQPCHLKIV